MEKIFLLLVLFQIKHFIADFPLQNTYMLGKFKRQDWVLPLSCHCIVHAILTWLISLCFKPEIAFQLATLDFVIHFIMDRIKASPKRLGKYKALTASEFEKATEEQKKSNTYFWWALGLDQGVHHLTHYLIIYFLI